MAGSLVPSIIVLALGAGALGFPDALLVLVQIAGRSPLTDIAICVFAMSVVTAQALGSMLLARFVLKAARAGGDANAPAPRTDCFAQVTLVVSLAVAFLVSACLLVASGAASRGLSLLHLIVAGDIARKMKSPVIAALATTTAAVLLPCARPLLRVFFREEDHSHSQGTGHFGNMTQVASFTGVATAAFLLAAVSGGVYIQRAPLVGVAAVVATVLLPRFFTFTRRARNAAGAGGRAAPSPAADTRRVGRLTRLAPYLAVVAFAALFCCLVLTTYAHAPLQSGSDGAKEP